MVGVQKTTIHQAFENWLVIQGDLLPEQVPAPPLVTPRR